MKTINIQNCTDLRDRFFKVIVNGEKHVIPHQYLTIHVDDDKPFTIKAKYFLSFSSVYTFESKDNISLQIFFNRRLMRWTWLGWIVIYSLGMMVMKFYENIFYAGIIFLLVAVICEIFKNKTYFVIKEVSTENKE